MASSSYSIKPGNIFGRLGQGIGQGINEQLPKEVERYRMGQHLENLDNQKNLSPFQRFSGLLATPGITPQGIQSGGELLKQQSLRQAFSAGGNKPERTPGASPELNELSFAQKNGMSQKKSVIDQAENPRNVLPDERGQPQVNPKNPLRQEAQPRPPWTSEKRIEDIGKLGERFPQLSFPELSAMSAENEARELAQPEAERKKDEALRDVQERLTNKFQSSLEKKLQKKGPETFGDITGEMQNNLIRGMENDLASNPNASEDDVVNTWTNKALNLAKAKSDLFGLANDSLFATPILLNKEEYRNKLENYGDIYRKAGNSEEFYKTLQTQFKMSPSGAASLAYPLNKGMKDYVSKAPAGKPYNLKKQDADARKIALDIQKTLRPDDSILSIARALQHKDANFDIRSFFNQLRQDKDEIGLTDRQRRELGEGVQMLPSWGDLLILPVFRGL